MQRLASLVAGAIAGSLAVSGCGSGAHARVRVGLTSRPGPEVRADCSRRSTGNFQDEFHSPHSIVVGPLAFAVAADAASASVGEIGRFGGWKSPALLLPGHTVTVQVAPSARGRAGLVGYGHEARGADPLRSADRSVTFLACDRRRSDSRAGGRRVTFWAGSFVARSLPACVPLDVWVDHERAPRRIVVSLAAGRCALALT